MFFTVKPISQDTEYNKTKLVQKARSIILLCKLGPAEKQLDAYIKKHYKSTLKLMCIRLLQNCHINEGKDKELIVTFLDKKLDNIAALITYGDGKIPGSNILAAAFDRGLK